MIGKNWPPDDVIKWKHFPRYWPFVRGIHRWPKNSPHKGQRCTYMNIYVNDDLIWISAYLNLRVKQIDISLRYMKDIKIGIRDLTGSIWRGQYVYVNFLNSIWYEYQYTWFHEFNMHIYICVCRIIWYVYWYTWFDVCVISAISDKSISLVAVGQISYIDTTRFVYHSYHLFYFYAWLSSISVSSKYFRYLHSIDLVLTPF